MSLPDPGSFRDPASRVVHDGERVLRMLDARGTANWRRLRGSAFFRRSVSAGSLIDAREVPNPGGDGVTVLEHPRIPFISYPYEWTFSMLKEAALLHLDLLAQSLREGLTIKDASAFNIQFLKGRPVFIDIGSFEPYRPGDPWLGYRQFTRHFLYPLMMRAWVGIPFQPWLRGSMDGPTAEDMRRMLRPRRRLRPTVFAHVSLQARLERRMAGRSVRSELRAAGFSADLILRNVKHLRSLVGELEKPEDGGVWGEYASWSHVARTRELKARFLVDAIRRIRPATILDLGANDGYYAKLASERGVHVVAVDRDEDVLDGLFRSLDGADISVVLNDVADPSPARGWAGTERPGLITRVRPDMVVMFGLVHHLMYSESVPLPAIVTWLKSFRCPILVEFVDPTDPMVEFLVANKLEEELHPRRTLGEFRSEIDGAFTIVSERELTGGDRTLLLLQPR